MASPSNARMQAIEQGIAILAESFERKADLKEFAQTLDGSEIASLQRLIETIIECEDLDWDLLPSSMQEYCGFELAMDAAELLAHKISSASIPLIERLFRDMAKEDAELLSECGPKLVGLFAPEAASAWLACVGASKKDALVASVILDGIAIMAAEHVSIQQELAPNLVQRLTAADRTTPELNGHLVLLASHWKLAEAAEVIERAYSRNLVDCGIAGNWETVRQALAVNGLGLPMPAKPIDSLKSFRLANGIGAFSDVPLFADGELDESAISEYLTKVREAFRESEWNAGSTNRSCGDVISTFLDLGLNYLGVHVENMTEGHAREILLELFPQKVSQSADESDSTIDELVAFWNHCDRVHQLEHAAGLAKTISSWRQKFHEAMSNPANFGMAKSLVMSGTEAGFDMTTEAGTAAFVQHFNRSRAASRQAATGRRDTASSSVPSPFAPYNYSDDAPADAPIPKDLKQRKKLLKKLKRK